MKQKARNLLDSDDALALIETLDKRSKRSVADP